MIRFQNIISISNPHVREALAIKDKRRRFRYHAFLIEGHHLVQMALQSGTVMKKVFFTEDYLSHREGIHELQNVREAGAELFQISRQILARLSDTETPQGIIAMGSYDPTTLVQIPFRGIPLLVVLDGIQDPGNLGTIIRTSDAAGIDAVIILPETCDVFMPKVLRATAGSIFNIPIVFSGADTLIKYLREKSITSLVTDVSASDTIYQADLSKPLALVFGNEAHGAGKKIKEQADALLKIPIFGRAESLNVAISAAISIFEAVRQRTSRS